MMTTEIHWHDLDSSHNPLIWAKSVMVWEYLIKLGFLIQSPSICQSTKILEFADIVELLIYFSQLKGMPTLLQYWCHIAETCPITNQIYILLFNLLENHNSMVKRHAYALLADTLQVLRTQSHTPESDFFFIQTRVCNSSDIQIVEGVLHVHFKTNNKKAPSKIECRWKK